MTAVDRAGGLVCHVEHQDAEERPATAYVHYQDEGPFPVCAACARSLCSQGFDVQVPLPLEVAP